MTGIRFVKKFDGVFNTHLGIPDSPRKENRVQIYIHKVVKILEVHQSNESDS